MFTINWAVFTEKTGTLIVRMFVLSRLMTKLLVLETGKVIFYNVKSGLF